MLHVATEIQVISTEIRMNVYPVRDFFSIESTICYNGRCLQNPQTHEQEYTIRYALLTKEARLYIKVECVNMALVTFFHSC